MNGNENQEMLFSALEFLNPADLDYSEWVQVGMGLKEEGLPCSVWDNWSQRDSGRYHSRECEKKWNGFHGSASPVTAGTIVQMAKDAGWTPHKASPVLDWDDTISFDGEAFNGFSEEEKAKPSEELIRYLSTLFREDEYVSYVSNDVWERDGKYMPSAGIYTRTAGDIIEDLKAHPDDIGAVIGDWKEEAGAWIRFNPMDGKGIKNENVTRYAYALVESDTVPLEEQYDFMISHRLPIAALVHSGKKSLHAIVKVDADSLQEYQKRVDRLYSYLRKEGFDVDGQNKNPSRLSRLPGVTRNGHVQKLIATEIGCRSWIDWLDYVEGEDDELPDMATLADFADDPPELLPELIGGILRRGHKMLVSGSSKAGKSFLLMELCIAIAEGIDWLGFPCTKGKVLYVNLEIDPASAINRFLNIYKAMDVPMENAENIVTWNLRGHALPLDKLTPKLVRRVKDQQFDAIIIDPIYKVITGDENNASEMGAFCNQFDKICQQTGCATIYCHHHSKGAQGAKKAMDRASGSGVFARDPDAQLDMIELEMSSEIENFVRDGRATAWRLESSLREFPNIKPKDFWFEYPVHKVDDKGVLDECGVKGTIEAARSRNPKASSKEERKEALDRAYEQLKDFSGDAPVTVDAIAGYVEKTPRCIQNWLKEFSDEYESRHGTVWKTGHKNENGKL